MEQVSSAREKGFALLGVNLIYRFVPDLALTFATNLNFWSNYDDWRVHPSEKWTNCREAADRFGLNYIDAKNAPGLSANPSIIHHGHSSGFCLLNLAFLMGARRIILLGYDMRFAHDYCGYTQRVGSSPRHFFGEYVSDCLHWPKVAVRQGVHFELVNLYAKVADQNCVEIINCTGPNSAVTCFPQKDIADVGRDGD